MKTKYIYIHGFNSGPNSDTVKRLRSAGLDVIGLTYDYTNPRESVTKLACQIIEGKYDWVCVIGSSLGGWYAEQLTNHIVADFILFNPATNPALTLSELGVPQDVTDKYDAVTHVGPSRRQVILSIDDNVISYRAADALYRNKASIKYTSGGHRVSDDSFGVLMKSIKEMDNQL